MTEPKDNAEPSGASGGSMARVRCEARVVRLPSPTKAMRHGLTRFEEGYLQGLRDARKALDAAGVKWEVTDE